MDKSLRQRLVGAAVVVALAVIFVPELVKQPVGQDQPVANTVIPPRPNNLESNELTLSLPEPTPPVPEQTASPASAELAETATTAPQPPAPVEASETTITSDLEAESDATATAQEDIQEDSKQSPPLSAMEPSSVDSFTESSEMAAAPPAPERPVVPAVAAEFQPPPPEPEPEPESMDTAKTEPSAKPKPALIKTKTPPAKPTAKPKSPTKPASKVVLPKIELIGRSNAEASLPAVASRGASNWAVQVGSFALLENAELMRYRLRAGRFDASLESVNLDGRTLYRVRVGPQTSEAESKRIQERLKRELGISGNVVSLNN